MMTQLRSSAIASLPTLQAYVKDEQEFFQTQIEQRRKKETEERDAKIAAIICEDPIYSPHLPTAAEVKKNPVLGVTDHLFLEAEEDIEGEKVPIIIGNIYDPRASFGFAPVAPLDPDKRARAIVDILKKMKAGVIMLQEEFIYYHKKELGIDIEAELKEAGLICIARQEGDMATGLLTIYNSNIFSEHPTIKASLETAGDAKEYGGAPYKWLRTTLVHKKSGKLKTYDNAYYAFTPKTPYPHQKAEIVKNALKKDAEETKSDVVIAGDFNSNIYTPGQPRITQISQPLFRGGKGYGAASTDGGFSYSYSSKKTKALVFKPINHLKYLGLSLDRKEFKLEKPKTTFERDEMNNPRLYMRVADEDIQWQPFVDRKITLDEYQAELRTLTKDSKLIIDLAIGMNEDDKPVISVKPSQEFFDNFSELLKDTDRFKEFNPPNSINEKISTLVFSPEHLPIFHQYVKEISQPILEKFTLLDLQKKWSESTQDKNLSLRMDSKKISLNVKSEFYHLMSEKLKKFKIDAKSDRANRYEFSISIEQISELNSMVEELCKPLPNNDQKMEQKPINIFAYSKDLRSLIDDEQLMITFLDDKKCHLNISNRVTAFLKSKFPRIQIIKKGEERAILQIPLNLLMQIKETLDKTYNQTILKKDEFVESKDDKNIIQYVSFLRTRFTNQDIHAKVILDRDAISAFEFTLPIDIAPFIQYLLKERPLDYQIDNKQVKLVVPKSRLSEFNKAIQHHFLNALPGVPDPNSFHIYIGHGKQVERRRMHDKKLGFGLSMPSDIADYLLSKQSEFKGLYELSREGKDDDTRELFVPIEVYDSVNDDLLTHYRDITIAGKNISECKASLRQWLGTTSAHIYKQYDKTRGWEFVFQINEETYRLLPELQTFYSTEEKEFAQKPYRQVYVPLDRADTIFKLFEERFNLSFFEHLKISDYQSLLLSKAKGLDKPQVKIFYYADEKTGETKLGVCIQNIPKEKMEKILLLLSSQEHKLQADMQFIPTDQFGNKYNLFMPLEKIRLVDACFYQAYIPDLKSKPKKQQQSQPQSAQPLPSAGLLSWVHSTLFSSFSSPKDLKVAPAVEENYPYALVPALFIHYVEELTDKQTEIEMKQGLIAQMQQRVTSGQSNKEGEEKLDFKKLNQDLTAIQEERQKLKFRFGRYVDEISSICPQLTILDSLFRLAHDLKKSQYNKHEKQLIAKDLKDKMKPTDLLIRPETFFDTLNFYRRTLKNSCLLLQRKDMNPFLRNAIMADLIAFGNVLKEIYKKIDWNEQYKFRQIYNKAVGLAVGADRADMSDKERDHKNAQETLKLFDILSGITYDVTPGNSAEEAASDLNALYMETGVFYRPSFISPFKLEDFQVDPDIQLIITSNEGSRSLLSMRHS